MKMFVQRTPSSAEAPFTLPDIKTHLRIDYDDDDSALENIGWTAAAEIEQFAQIALVFQTITVTIFNPVQADGITLPIGPLAAGQEPNVSVDGQVIAGLEIVSGIHPYIRWPLPLCAERVVIAYQAGFGPAVGDIPRDLTQALLDQAALHYDGRSPMDAKSLTTSPHMARVAARYRGVSL